MKKTLVMAILSSSILAGCISTSDQVDPVELQANYKAVASEEFKLAQITAISQVATTVNQLFQESYPIYEDYVAYVQTTNGVGASHSAALTMLESDEDRQKYVQDLKANNPTEYADYDAFVNDTHMQSIYKRAAVAALESAVQATAIAQMDTSSLISGSDLSFDSLLAEKDVIALMTEQMSVLNSTIVALKDEHDANKAAQAIK